MYTKSYSELISLPTYEERVRYLMLGNRAGDIIDFNRYIKQGFYRNASEWKSIREWVILRDNCCDLALPGYDIFNRVTVHHINPLTYADISMNSPLLLDPENLITVSHDTHMMIHYGTNNIHIPTLADRKPGDQCPWRK